MGKLERAAALAELIDEGFPQERDLDELREIIAQALGAYDTEEGRAIIQMCQSGQYLGAQNMLDRLLRLEEAREGASPHDSGARSIRAALRGSER